MLSGLLVIRRDRRRRPRADHVDQANDHETQNDSRLLPILEPATLFNASNAYSCVLAESQAEKKGRYSRGWRRGALTGTATFLTTTAGLDSVFFLTTRLTTLGPPV